MSRDIVPRGNRDIRGKYIVPTSVYQPAWIRLKAKDRVRIEVEPENLKTVKRMISKRKDMDLAFKMMNADRYRLRFEYDITSKVLVIELRAAIGVFDKVIT